MSDKKEAAVVIPLYREKLSVEENISLRRVLDKLAHYDFYVICPKSLRLPYEDEKITPIRFADGWFASLRAYSALMLQKEFYEKFTAYEYILIHQPDCFLFSGGLSEFCGLGYDYIGAPWLHGILHYVDNGNIIQRIGNGGLSLRRVSAFIRWLEHVDLAQYRDTINEDILIAAYGKGWLRFPDEETALRFSFDLDPRGSYRAAYCRLPFGCHAWQRYDPQFWRPLIEKEGFTLEEDGCVWAERRERYERRYCLEDERNRLLEGVLEQAGATVRRLTGDGQRRLYVWGTGMWGTLIARIFRELGIPISGYLDNNGTDSGFMGYSVYKGEIVSHAAFHEHAILVAVAEGDAITRQLEENGYLHRKDYILLKDMRKMDWKEAYTFWDLIAEEAYLPEHERLRAHTWEQFAREADTKNIWLFGCNDACRTFLRLYGERYHIAGILDNASGKWGSLFEGIRIFSPDEMVQTMKEKQDENLILVTMRLNADKVAQQLDGMGFYHYYGLGVLLAGMEPYAGLIREVEDKKQENLRDIILLESTNDFDGNAGALYDYLKGKNSRHTFVWIIKEEQNRRFLRDETDIALCPRSSLEELKQYLLYRAVARWQIWDNHPIRKVRKDQVNVYLQHFGMGYKQIASIFNSPPYVDYALNTNENVYRYEKEALLYAPGTKMIFGELPRNDVLFCDQWRELEKITDRAYDKVIMWAPTLRDSALYNRSDSDISYPYGISVLYTEEEMQKLNRFLEEQNMLLLLKIHPRQKCDYRQEAYGNILWLDGKSVKQVHAYKLLTQIDAMITDYSSIVFDYMLLDRPIAWALEDMEHYKVPFLMEDPLAFMPGEKIYNLQDLFTFLEHVKEGRDPYREARRRLSAKYNAPKKGKGCEALAEMLGL